MPARIAAIARKHIARWATDERGSQHGSESVFPGGRPDRNECRGIVGEAALRGALDRVAEVAGVPRITFHGLRHTAGTALAEAGFMEKAIMTRLGHRTRTMVDVYIHIARSADQRAADHLDAALTSRVPEAEDAHSRGHRGPQGATRGHKGPQKGPYARFPHP
jgi:integrase